MVAFGSRFAIPSPMVELVADQLREYSHLHRPVIGIGVQAGTPVLAAALRLARSSGVIVSDITADSPAEKAGLKLNDLIVSVEGRAVHNVPMSAMTMLQSKPNEPLKMEILRAMQPGDAVALLIERDGRLLYEAFEAE